MAPEASICPVHKPTTLRPDTGRGLGPAMTVCCLRWRCPWGSLTPAQPSLCLHKQACTTNRALGTRPAQRVCECDRRNMDTAPEQAPQSPGTPTSQEQEWWKCRRPQVKGDAGQTMAVHRFWRTSQSDWKLKCTYTLGHDVHARRTCPGIIRPHLGLEPIDRVATACCHVLVGRPWPVADLAWVTSTCRS